MAMNKRIAILSLFLTLTAQAGTLELVAPLIKGQALPAPASLADAKVDTESSGAKTVAVKPGDDPGTGACTSHVVYEDHAPLVFVN
jgi:hypothetical protein